MKSFFLVAPVAVLLGILTFFCSTAFTTESVAPADAYGTISVRVSGINPGKGVVRFMLYNNEKTFLVRDGFMATDSAYASADGTVKLTLRNVPFGIYAAAYYQDVNHNGRFDSNAMRVPQEPYAFSNGVRAKWGKPDYDKLLFQFNRPDLQMTAVLRSWSDQ